MEIDKTEDIQEQEAGLNSNHGHAALYHSEEDFSEGEESLEDSLDEDEHKHVDYSSFSKQQLVNLIKDLSKDNNF
ncbi:MAG: hypothetical protein ACOYXT_28805, partial [Bacteroidota bacterium]